MSELIFPLWFKRQYAAPLDVDLVFDTLVDMNDYLTSGVRYAGQIVSCKENEGKLFVLNNARDAWLEIGNEEVGELVSTVNGITGDIFINGIGGIQVDSLDDTITLSVSGDFITTSEVTLISSGLDARLDFIESDYLNQSDYDSLEAITISLSSAIDSIEQEQTIIVGISGIGVVEDPTHTWTISVTGDYVSQTQFSDELANFNNQSGTVACLTGQKVYTINHILADNYLNPVCSLVIPEEDSSLYISGIFDITPTSFKVVLSESPQVSGYQISWMLSHSSISNFVVDLSGTQVSIDDTDINYLDLYSIPSHLLPSDNLFFSLGSNTKLWENVYLSDTLYFNTNTLNVSSGSLLFNGETIENIIVNHINSDYTVINKLVQIDNELSGINGSLIALQTDIVNVSGSLQSQIDSIVQEGTSIESSGNTLIVTQDNLHFNLEVADYISKTEVALISSNLFAAVPEISSGRYFETFTALEVISGDLQITHDLNEKWVSVVLFDSQDKIIVPDSVTLNTLNSLTVTLDTFEPIIGTWGVLVLSNAGGSVVADTYSTSEIKTDKKWINGKPIYRRVIEWVGDTPNNSIESNSHGINFETIIDSYLMVTDTNTFKVAYNGVGYESFQINATNIVWGSAEDRSLATAFAVIEYTK